MAEIVPFPAPRSPREPRHPREPEPLWRHLVGAQLRRRRHDRGDTLTETAASAGVSPQYLSEIERGLKEPSSEILAAVAGALDLSLLELASGVADALRPVTSQRADGARPTGGALALAA
ncbi:helix-turn-helix domain-containing protein [Microbacterium sp.]|uniref:helix-turn-helix domain-containing protein n=1 Tax=Microbacterium sp. TaxID=51671 RepID=UPI002811D9FA|nr:helix-turn-helix transcriptional regulator [Microbacterium sp.]